MVEVTIEALTQIRRDTETWEIEVKVGKSGFRSICERYFVADR